MLKCLCLTAAYAASDLQRCSHVSLDRRAPFDRGSQAHAAASEDFEAWEDVSSNRILVATIPSAVVSTSGMDENGLPLVLSPAALALPSLPEPEDPAHNLFCRRLIHTSCGVTNLTLL